MVLMVSLVWSGASAAAEQTYVVKSGETLDQVIKKTMGDSPLRIEVLRRAFTQQNPQAFTKTSPRVLMAGSVLTIPDGEVLLKMQGSNKSTPGAQDHSGSDMMNERKNWVRFP